MVDSGIWLDLVACLRQSIRYVQIHSRVSTNFISALYSVVCLILAHFSSVFNSSIDSIIALNSYVCLKILYLATVIILVCFCKSLPPRYKFLNGRVRSRGFKSGYHSLGCQFHEMQPDTIASAQSDSSAQVREVSLKEALVKFLLAAGRRQRLASKACSNAVTDGNIQSIFKQISWSSTRPEFESVYWFNHTVQSLWPAGMTLMHKYIHDAIAKPKSGNKNQATKEDQKSKLRKTKILKLKMIRPGDKRALKLSDFISCRRQLELLHKNKRRALGKGDEHLILKSVFMIVYMIKKFALCFKQYLIDQLYWLAVNLTSNKSRPFNRIKSENRLIEVDLNDLTLEKRFKFKLNKRRTKSASEPAGTFNKSARANRTKFRSAPESGLACNSRRIVVAGRLISFDGMKSLRSKRQKLVRSVNEMVRESRDRAETRANKNQKRVTVERLELGEKAPEITAIKFLEKNDDMLAETLIGSSPISSSTNSNTMHLIIELSFESGKNFQICLSSVPLLDKLRLAKLDVRLRLLVAINHVNFDNHDNLDIRRAFNTNQLLPIFNQIQVALVDLPQLNWRIKRAYVNQAGVSPTVTNQNIRGKHNRTRSKETNKQLGKLAQAPVVNASRHLELFRLINHSYFKYLVHCIIYYLQRWFRPFDILIGEKLFLKTLW